MAAVGGMTPLAIPFKLSQLLSFPVMLQDGQTLC